MSVMGMEPVGLDFNVTGNYSASLNQMIAQADQYAKSADTMIGRVAALNVGITALIGKTNALTQANKVATAEAAAYQQRLSGIEATARVTGKSFDSLAASTLKLGRETGRMGEAVRIVESLGSSGVTAEKSVASLAKTWSNLGAANSFDPVALGQGLLNLGRTFGNSEAQLKSYGDALTTLSKTYGASVDGTLSFAKALAPVAANVGVTQGAILGLSTAAARLGEDGFAGANAFNKVLLDMSRSIRSGSPEIKEYALLLGMTQKQLADLFRENPTEALVRFTEAIGKGGQGSMRTLETLGLDATRTVRAITALSSQGNLRQIIDDATSSYGNDSTAKAAEVALGGVNDSMAKLTETMSQTVAGAGRPFLGFLEKAIDLSTSFAEVINKIVNADLTQWLGKVGAVLSFGGGIAMNAVTGLGLLGLGKAGLGAARGALGAFQGGVAAQRAGGPVGPVMANGSFYSSPLGQLGMAYGAQVPQPLFGPRTPGMFNPMTAIRGGANWAALLATSQARMMDPLVDGKTAYSTMGQATRDRIGAAWGARDSTGLGKAMGEITKASGAWVKDVTVARGAASNLGGALARLTVQTTMAAGAVAKGAGGMIGRGIGMLGLNPWMLAAGGAIAGGMAIKDWRDDQDAKFQAVAGHTDANSAFNEFAAAAGIAGKGLMTLAETIKKTTQDIANSNADITETYELSREQEKQASALGYQRAFNSDETSDPKRIAAKARLMLGSNPTAGQLSRVAMDVENQYPGTGQLVLDELSAMRGGPVYSQGLAAASAGRDWKGRTDESVSLTNGLYDELARQVDKAVSVYGSGALEGAKIGESAKLYASVDTSDSGQVDAAAQVIAKALGTDYEFVKSALGGGLDFNRMTEVAASGRGIYGAGMYVESPGESPWAKQALSYRAQGYDLTNMSLAAMGNEPAGLTAAKDLDYTFTQLNGKATGFVTALYGAESAARANKTTVEALTEEQISSMNAISAATARYLQDMSPQNLNAAGSAVSRDALTATGLRSAMTGQQLQQAMSGMALEDPRRAVLMMGLTNVQAGSGILNRGMGAFGNQQAAIDAMNAARAQGPETFEQDEAARRATIDAGMQAYGERIDFMKQYIQADKQLTITLARQQEDRDLQLLRSTQDFNKQRMRAQRDFNIQMERMSEDAAKAIYDPYQRIQAQTVWDAGSLMANLSEQNAAIKKQTSSVDRLKDMGLSQDVIDTLGLADSKNAQQVDRLLADVMSNPAVIASMNRMIADRLKNTKAATQDEDNIGYRRAQEDFKRSMRDTEKDFRTSIDRMEEDLGRSTRRAYEDLARMGSDVDMELTDIAADFLRRVGDMPLGIRDSMSTNLKLTIASAAQDAKDALDAALAPYGLDSSIVTQTMANAWMAYRQQTQGGGSAGSTAGYPNTGSATMENPFPGAYQTQAYSRAHGGLDLSSGPGDADAGAIIRALSSGKVTGASHSPTSGGVIEITHANGYRSKYHHLNARSFKVAQGDSVAPGQPIGSLGLTKLSVGSNASDYGMGGSHNTGAHLHLAVFKTGANIDPTPFWKGQRSFFGQGGIVTQRTDATLGETGHAEAAIPLDQRGAEFLARTMVRYVDAGRVQQARVQPYAQSTSVTHYSYDQRVQVSGPITVRADDPASFGRKMEAKAAYDRLVQPVGRP